MKCKIFCGTHGEEKRQQKKFGDILFVTGFTEITWKGNEASKNAQLIHIHPEEDSCSVC
jgi:hypothetical protein